ncbi:MAG: hypothetical protein MJB14_01100 [Spirochaetes bacterium]|nr:hypothetical protein [Spirochaetota bacterium]
MTKNINKIFFFLLFIIAFTGIFFNIIIIQTLTGVNSEFLKKMDGIYFEKESIPQEYQTTLLNLMDTNNSAFFKILITQRNGVANFYGLCGLLKIDPNNAFGYFEKNPLLSERKVKLMLGEETLDTTFSDTILYLFDFAPQWLLPTLSKDFLKNHQSYFMEAFQSDVYGLNKDQKLDLLLVVITKYFPELMDQIIKEVISADIINANTDQKYKYAKMIPYIKNKYNREKIIEQLLLDTNSDVLSKTIENIDKNANIIIKQQLEELIYNSNDNKVLSSSLKKFAEIENDQALEIAKKILRGNNDSAVLIEAINIIGKYGNSSHYELLTQYLSFTKLNKDINIAALQAIISTTYWAKPDNVLNTLAYVIKNAYSSRYELVVYSIEFYIKRNINRHSGLILSRLKYLENEEMKKLAIQYLDHFQLTSGLSLLNTLKNDNNPEISKEASQLYDILKKKVAYSAPTPTVPVNNDNNEDETSDAE